MPPRKARVGTAMITGYGLKMNALQYGILAANLSVLALSLYAAWMGRLLPGNALFCFLALCLIASNMLLVAVFRKADRGRWLKVPVLRLVRLYAFCGNAIGVLACGIFLWKNFNLAVFAAGVFFAVNQSLAFLFEPAPVLRKSVTRIPALNSSPKALPASSEIARTVLGLVWCLKPSDRSILVAMRQMEDPLNCTVATIRGKGNGIFWQTLTDMGLAYEETLKETELTPDVLARLKAIKAARFRLNETGWKLINPLLDLDVSAGAPPADAIIVPQVISILKYYAEDGKDQAQLRLGQLYSSGRGVVQDFGQAIYWYQRAAEMGNPAAQNNLGMAYYTGQGVERDYARAMGLFLEASAKQSPVVFTNIAVMYLLGHGVPKDTSVALDWLLKAADKNYSSAMIEIGKLYAKGNGVTQDNIAAYMWFTLAGKHGDKTAAEWLAIGETLMTPQQISEAKERADEWKPRVA